MKCVAPMRVSYSTAMVAEGPPMPVEQTLIGVPPGVVPVYRTYSRCRATSVRVAKASAMRSARPGSPGMRT
jgi:hypothetical protein